MSGQTGKLTTEALAARGPRMVLLSVDGHPVICREGQDCVSADAYTAKHPSGTRKHRIAQVAKSFTLGYLLKIGGHL